MNDRHFPDRPTSDETQERDEPFMSRWSRRKLERSEPASEGLEATVSPPAEPEATRTLTDEDLPPLETLSDDADFSGFLSPGVSEELRQRALKRLFSAARYNVVDGLDDYAEDFTQFTPLGETVTHEMRRLVESELEKVDEKARAQREIEARDSATAIDLDQENENGRQSDHDSDKELT